MLLFPFCVFVLCCSTVLSGYCNVSLHSFGILGVMKLHHFAWHSPFKDHGPRKPRSHCVDTVKHFDTAFSSEVLNVGEINLWNCLNFASNYFKKPTRFIPFSGFQVCQSFGIWMFHLASTTFLSQVPYYLREIINNIIVFLVCTALKLQILVFSLLIYDLVCTSHLGRKSICYFLKSHNTPLSPPPPTPPKKIHRHCFFISLGTSSCPRRNRKLWLCKILGGKWSVLWDLRKKRMEETYM